MDVFVSRNEWPEHETRLRRSRVAFEAEDEHFLFIDHPCVLDFGLIDATHGYAILRHRKRRSFFSRRLLPDIARLFFLDRALVPCATAGWCAQ